MFDFSGKNALITGAASGIGLATARYFHACGAKLLLADINISALRERVKDFAPTQERMELCEYDASQPESADQAVAPRPHALSANSITCRHAPEFTRIRLPTR